MPFERRIEDTILVYTMQELLQCLQEKHYQALSHFLIITSIPKSLIYHSRGLNKNASRLHASLLRIMKHYTSTLITH